MTPERALALLAPALEEERALLTIEDIRDQVEANRGIIWSGDRSAIFTQLTEYPDKGELVIEAGPAGGSLSEILGAVPHIEEWARGANCTQAMLTVGRRGWVRALREYGYQEYATILRKIL